MLRIAWCTKRSEEGTGLHETEVTDSFNNHVGARNKICVLCKNSKYLLLTISGPTLNFPSKSFHRLDEATILQKITFFIQSTLT